MRVGDTVIKTISCSISSRSGMGATWEEEQIEYEGKVIYVHPKGRFYTVEFTLPFGTIRESYKE